MATARSFEDLVAWKLSAELRDRIVRLSGQGEMSRDFRFCGQIRAAAGSAAGNLAEGFGRFDPGDFARFATIARASLDETRNHIKDAETRGYIAPEDSAALQTLTKRASTATTRLIKYLRSRKAKAHAQRIREGLKESSGSSGSKGSQGSKRS